MVSSLGRRWLDILAREILTGLKLGIIFGISTKISGCGASLTFGKTSSSSSSLNRFPTKSSLPTDAVVAELSLIPFLNDSVYSGLMKTSTAPDPTGVTVRRAPQLRLTLPRKLGRGLQLSMREELPQTLHEPTDLFPFRVHGELEQRLLQKKS